MAGKIYVTGDCHSDLTVSDKEMLLCNSIIELKEL